jgi:hypothetical protein
MQRPSVACTYRESFCKVYRTALVVTVWVYLARIHIDLLKPRVVQMCLWLRCNCNACLSHIHNPVMQTALGATPDPLFLRKTKTSTKIQYAKQQK